MGICSPVAADLIMKIASHAGMRVPGLLLDVGDWKAVVLSMQVRAFGPDRATVVWTALR
jgi:hypothetical protein